MDGIPSVGAAFREATDVSDEARPVWLRLLTAVIAVALATALRWLLVPVLDDHAVVPFFLLAILASTAYGGLWSGWTSLALSVVAADALFVQGRNGASWLDAGEMLQLALLLVSGGVVVLLAENLRRSRQQALRLHREGAQTLAELQESEARFRLLVMDSPDAIFEQDTDLRLTRIVNLPPSSPASQYLGQTDANFLGAEEVARLRPIKQRVMDSGTPARFETAVELGGERRTFDTIIAPRRNAAGQTVGVIGYARDITPLKRAERALRDSESQLRLITDALPALVSYVGADRRYRFVNHEYQNWFGHPPEEVCGRHVRDVLGDQAYESILPHVDAALVGTPCRFESWIDYKEGGKRCVEARYVPHRGAEGEVLGFFALVSDVSERRRYEEQLRDLNETLEHRVSERTAEAQKQASQLRALASELAQTEQRERRRLAKLLHDHLQQLLVAAKLSIGMAATRAENPAQQQMLAQVNGLLNNSIEASRSLAVELSPPVLDDGGLAAALDWLGRWMEDKHGLKVTVRANAELDPDSDDLRVTLFEVVRELLFNIVKHAHVAEAAVEMRAANVEELEIVVSDAGSGFDPAHVRERGGEATGFGLLSVYHRLELLGGRATIESAPGRGTRVTLVTPRASSSEIELPELAGANGFAMPAERDAGFRLPGGETVRVLLVDDHQIVREGLRRLLEDHGGIEVVGEAGDGRTAVERTRALHPDLVVMDINMPEMNGLEATRRIHAEMPHVRIIGLSLHERDDMADAMIAAGATAYFTKGGSYDDLLSAIRQMQAKVPSE